MKKTLTVLLLAFFACAALFAGCNGANDGGDKDKSYTITYELDGGSIEGEYKTSYKTSEAFALPVPVKENFEFICWKDGEGKEWKEISKTTVGNKIFYANWRQVIFAIDYELNGGENNPDNPSSYSVRGGDIELKAPVRAGYKFLGWADKDSSEEGYVAKIPAGSMGDRTFVAVWEKTTFSITYDLGGGTNSSENPAEYSTESETITLAPATRAGYKFLGWVDKNSSATGYVTEIPAGSTGDRTFVAVWEKTTFSITYDLGGGTNSPENPAEYSTESETITLAPATRAGYKFLGWVDKNSSATGYVTEIPAGSTGDKTFVAAWEKTTFSITYDLGGGTNSPENPAEYSTESETITLAPATRADYKFLGWVDKNSSATGYVTEIPAGSTGDKIFVAVWEKTTFSISYDLGGGTNSPENPDFYDKYGDDIILKAPEREGFEFLGWIEASSAGTEFVTEIPSGSTGDKTFVAQWKKEALPEAEIFEVKYELSYKGERSYAENPSDVAGAEIKEGEAFIGLLPSVLPENRLYRFVGWVIIKGEEEIRVTAGTAAEKTFTGEDGKTITLTAKVERYAYEIEYVLEYNGVNSAVDGHDTVDNGVIGKDETFEGKLLAFVPVNDFYKAAGWVAVINGTEREITAETEFSAEFVGDDGVIKLYAKAIRYKYTLKYELTYDEISSTVEGKTEVADGIMQIGESFAEKLPDFVPVSEMYSAVGWVTNIDGTGTRVTFATVLTEEMLESDGESIKLYAKAIRYKYTLKYELTYDGISSTVEGKTEVADGVIAMGESFLKKLPEFSPTTEGYASAGWVLKVGGAEEKINAATVLTENMLEADGATVKVYAKAVYMDEVTIVYNLIDALLRDYHSNYNGTSVSYGKYTDQKNPLTVGGKVAIENGTIKNGETFFGKLPAFDQTNCGWVYKSKTGEYVYVTDKTTFDMKKAEVENGKIILYACMTEYWIGPY